MRQGLIFLALLLLLSACGSPRPPMPPTPTADVLLQRLAEQGRWQQLDTAADVGLTRNGSYMSTQQYLLMERPDRIRVDVMSLFGQLALQLTVAEGELEVFLNTTVPGQYYQGPASDELLARFTRLPLRASELVALMLHDPPVPSTTLIGVETIEDRFLLKLGDALRQQQFLFDAEHRLRGVRYYRGEELQLAVEYSKIDDDDGFPRKVRVEVPPQQIRVSLKLSDLRLNEPVKAGRFDLKPPQNAVPLELGLPAGGNS